MTNHCNAHGTVLGRGNVHIGMMRVMTQRDLAAPTVSETSEICTSNYFVEARESQQ